MLHTYFADTWKFSITFVQNALPSKTMDQIADVTRNHKK